jgi:hypothetical protein
LAKRISRAPEIEEGEDLALARTAAGSIGNLEPRVQQELGIPYAHLTKEQWERIKTKTGLGESALFEINIALKRYWQTYLDEEYRSVGAGQLLDSAKLGLGQALEKLGPVLTHTEIFKAPFKFDQQTPLQQRLSVERAYEAIQHAYFVLEQIQAQQKRNRGDRQYGPLYDLIHHLDFILFSQVGVKVTRSTNRIPSGSATDTPMEYIWTVVSIANLKVAKATVDSMLRDYISDRDEHDRAFPKRAV